LDFPDPARSVGRYHDVGGPGAWYASSTERAAWAELARHITTEGLSPFEIRRRVGRVLVDDLTVLDLTGHSVSADLGVAEAALVGDDYAACRHLAELARGRGADGLLAPSAALPGELTLVVFATGIPALVAEHSRIQRPPVTLVDVMARIRSVPDAPSTVRDLLADLAAGGRDAVRRSRAR
jgi:RES domain-containing protein